jgi:hypothetical protein
MSFTAGDIVRFEGATTSRIIFWKNDNPSDFGMHRNLEHGDVFVVLADATNDMTFFKVVDSSGAVGSLPSPNSEAYWKVVKP